MFKPTTQADVDSILPLREAAVEALARYIAQAGVVGTKVAVERALTQGQAEGGALLVEAAKVLDNELRTQVVNAAYERAITNLDNEGLGADALAVLGL